MTRTRLAAAVLAALSTHAIAETPAPQYIEQVIVTGSRFAESLDEVPVSVTVVTKEEIQQQLRVTPEIQSLMAILVPGLAPSNNSSSNSGTTLRGRAPLVMIDGVPQSTPLRNGGLGMRTLDPNVIERIEVVKGATSIYGNGAAGGIINYITRQPSEQSLSAEVSLAARASAVKFDDSLGYRTLASVSGTQDKLSYLVSYSRDERGVERDGEGDIIGTVYGLSESVTQNIFTKANYQFDESQSLLFTYNYYEGQQNADLVDVLGSINDGEKTYAVKRDADTPQLGDPQGPRGNHNVMLKYTHNGLIPSTEMTIDAYGQVIENVFFYSNSFANPNEGYTGGQSMIKSDKKGLRFNFNTGVQFNFSDADFIYGLDMLNDVTSQPLLDGRLWVPEMDMNNVASYLQTKWVFADDIIVKSGVRHENIELSVDDYRTLERCSSPDACATPLDVKGDTLDYKATTYNLAVKYQVTPLFNPFANYSQGADISDIGRLLRAATVEDIALIQTEASIIDNYEIGIDSHFEKGDFSIAAYRSTSELGTSNSYNPNTGIYEPVRTPHKIWGYEAALNYRIADTLKASVNYSWVEGKDESTDEYLDARIISPPKLVAHLNWQPLDEATIGVTHLHVGERKRFEPDANGNWGGAYAPVSAYDVVNLNASYQLNQWHLFAGIENLLNEEYMSARSQAYTYSGGAYNSMSLGTTVTAGFTYQF